MEQPPENILEITSLSVLRIKLKTYHSLSYILKQVIISKGNKVSVASNESRLQLFLLKMLSKYRRSSSKLSRESLTSCARLVRVRIPNTYRAELNVTNTKAPLYIATIPYIKGTSETIGRILQPYNIRVAHKPSPAYDNY